MRYLNMKNTEVNISLMISNGKSSRTFRVFSRYPISSGYPHDVPSVGSKCLPSGIYNPLKKDAKFIHCFIVYIMKDERELDFRIADSNFNQEWLQARDLTGYPMATIVIVIIFCLDLSLACSPSVHQDILILSTISHPFNYFFMHIFF